jgi:hypothetical protein
MFSGYNSPTLLLPSARAGARDGGGGAGGVWRGVS